MKAVRLGDVKVGDVLYHRVKPNEVLEITDLSSECRVLKCRGWSTYGHPDDSVTICHRPYPEGRYDQDLLYEISVLARRFVLIREKAANFADEVATNLLEVLETYKLGKKE